MPASPTSPQPTLHTVYLLTGLVFCGICQRPMQAHWANGRPGYRCRRGRRRTHRHRTLYIREDQLLQQLRRLAHQLPMPELNDTSSLADHLRDRNLTITCRPDTWQLKTPTRVHHFGPHQQQEPLITESAIRHGHIPMAPQKPIPAECRLYKKEPRPPT